MADILIRGLRMPKIGEFPRSVLIHPWYKTAIPVEPGADNYEVVELPDHGRLCDLDAFMEEINQTCLALGNAGVEITGDMLWAKLWDAYENTDTIIPASKEATNAP